jgi:hypothetical protein
MKNINNQTLAGLSIITSIILSHAFTQPFTQTFSYIYVTPQIIITATLAVLSLSIFLNYLLMDFIKEKKITPFIIPIGVLLVVGAFAQRFFYSHPKFGSTEMVFFPSEFAGSLVVVTSLTLLFFTIYKLSTRIKDSNKKAD